jgi:hypothetical protein
VNHIESIGRAIGGARVGTMRSWPNTKHLGFTCVASKLNPM